MVIRAVDYEGASLEFECFWTVTIAYSRGIIESVISLGADRTIHGLNRDYQSDDGE